MYLVIQSPPKNGIISAQRSNSIVLHPSPEKERALMKLRLTLLVPLALILLTTNHASGSFLHFMKIQQIIGGVDGDVTAQAIELRMRFANQNVVMDTRLVVVDAAGVNPITILILPSDVANGVQGDRILIASAGFVSKTNPAATPDFTMTNLIPSGYLSAGSLMYQNPVGVIYWRLSWGNGSYTGDTTGNVANDVDGEFGPPFVGPLPSSGTQSLFFVRMNAPASSFNNAIDYELTGGDGMFINNEGDTFTVTSAPTGITPTPLATSLLQNRPNPFAPVTEIEFTLARAGHVRLEIFDVHGRLVTTLVDETVGADLNRAAWNGEDARGRRVGSGVYFYRLTTRGGTQTRKMVLLR